jgi:hypothetical protein
MGVGGLCIGSGLRSDVPVRTASSGGGPRPAADLPRPVRAETTGSTKRRIALRGARDAPSGEQERVASRRDRQSGAPSPTETPRRGKPSRIAGKVEMACRPRSGAAGDAPGWIRTSDPRIRSAAMPYPWSACECAPVRIYAAWRIPGCGSVRAVSVGCAGTSLTPPPAIVGVDSGPPRSSPSCR